LVTDFLTRAFAIRSLSRTPGLTAFCDHVALGIGMTSGTFMYVDALIFKLTPCRIERVVTLVSTTHDRASTILHREYLDIRGKTKELRA